MYCIHCGKELPDNSKFCNHCGGAQETFADIQSKEPQIEQPVVPKRKERKVTKKKSGCFSVAIVLFSLFIIFACFMASTEETEKENSGTANNSVTESTIEAPIEISASELIKAYVDNEVKADTLYDDKILKITGYVNRISQTDNLIMDNEPIIYIGTGNDIEACVRCYISADQKNIVAELEQGDKITVKGNCSGLGSSYFDLKCVSVFNCEIVE